MRYRQWEYDSMSDDYERLFYFTNTNHLLENLLGKKVKISAFSKCNDFFELASINLGDREMRKSHKAWVRKLEEKVGLICLSGDWRHPLMWAHYAAAGRGVCLVLDVKKEPILEVNYVSRRVSSKAALRLPSLVDPDFYEFCSTKANFWSYEQESRLFVDYSSADAKHEEGNWFLRFGSTISLVGIINGPRPALGMEAIKGAAPEVKYFQCRPANTRFEMVRNLDKTSWKQ